MPSVISSTHAVLEVSLGDCYGPLTTLGGMGDSGVLGFDTATADAAVAVSVGGELLCERRAEPSPEGRPRHATVLLEEVAVAVDAAGGWERIGLLAVGVGPGTFTGLRIGIATARALAQARGLAIAPVSSLATLARGLDRRRPCLAAIDARRGELFAALYDPGGRELWEPFVAAPAEVARRLSSAGVRPVALGDGSLRFRAQLEAAGADVPADADPAHRIAARHVCALADQVERVSLEQVEPIYLRRPDAEVWRERRDRDPAADGADRPGSPGR